MVSEITDVYDYVVNKRSKSKRTVFDLKYLEGWLEWANAHEFLFIHKINEKIDGVFVVIPVGTFETHPTIDQLINACNYQYPEETTDYFIMDGLVDNSVARLNIAKKIKDKFPRMATTAKTYAQKGDKIWVIPVKYQRNFTKY